MHTVRVTVTIALLLGMITARDLQALPPTPPPAPAPVPAPPAPPARVVTNTPLTYYGDDYTIPFATTHGCGACINSGGIYCILGKEGDDYSGKTITQKCCAAGSTAATCPELTNVAYTCSNVYNDRTLAKNICPYRSSACSSKNFFDNTLYGRWNTRDNITVTLNTGESCGFLVRAGCGIPSFIPSTTSGFDIESVDFTSADAPSLRFLQALPTTTTATAAVTTATTAVTNATAAAAQALSNRRKLPRNQQLPRRSFVVDTMTNTLKTNGK